MRNEVKGKKLLLLGGVSQHTKVVKAAKEMGVYVICVDPIIDSPAKQIADESYLYDVKDIEALTELCRRENVDGVLNVCLDPCQRPYQQICEKLDYPCFGDVKQFSILTNKRKFKHFCMENGVDVVPEIDINCLTAENSGIDFPVLVKPMDSRGSRGQTICHNVEDIKAAIPIARKESSDGEVLFEKYMGRNNDFMVAYLIVDSEPYLLRASDRYLGKQEDGLARVSIANLSPSHFTDIYIRNVHHNVKKMIKKLGIINGPFFMQGFIDGEKVRFYDPGLRFPASEYEVSLKTLSKVDVLKILIEFSLTGSMSVNHEKFSDLVYLNGHFAMSLYPTVRAGLIHEIIGLDKVEQMDNVVAFSQRYYEGDEVYQVNNVTQRFCAVEIIALTMDSLKTSIKLIQSTIKVLNKDGNNLIYGNFETNRIKTYENTLGPNK